MKYKIIKVIDSPETNSQFVIVQHLLGGVLPDYSKGIRVNPITGRKNAMASGKFALVHLKDHSPTARRWVCGRSNKNVKFGFMPKNCSPREMLRLICYYGVDSTFTGVVDATPEALEARIPLLNYPLQEDSTHENDAK